ncbi:penicillin-binding protein 2 [Candidatus Saccharibacteria bacterium]|nr:penicillin-binding protein 2 [Candidatus Saccharibacteria bacterium]
MSVSVSVQTNRRIIVLAALFVLLGLLIIGKLIYIQAFLNRKYLTQANQQQSRKFEIPTNRGEIFVRDSNGLYPVALNQRLQVVAVDPKFVKDAGEVASKLAPILGLNSNDIYAKIRNADSRYVEVKQRVSDSDASKIRDLNIAGVILATKAYRYYPEANLFSHVLGYVNADGEGQYGLEQYINEDLSGQVGQLKAVTDSLGVPISSTENTAVQPIDGTSYVLTLDRNIQNVARDALVKAVTDNRAESGSIIVMDPKTGAIKAMVSYPDYDPNNFSTVGDYKTFVNTAITSLYEPGSGFKIFTMSAGINTGKVKPDTTYNDTGEVKLGDKVIRNAENGKFGVQTMADVIQRSLNTGVVFVLRQLGGDPDKITLKAKQTLAEYFKKFGFGERTGIELADEANSPIKRPEKSADIDYANMAFGQGISVTSIQMITAAAAIANGGKLYQPQIIAESIAPNGTIKKTQPKLIDSNVVSPQTAAQVAQMMTRVVQNGSGWMARTTGYSIAGKTGTAQVPKADGSGYEESKNIGSFVGFAPVDDPKFVMLVRIDYPKVSGFAETTAVPAFAAIERTLFDYYNIPPRAN